MSAIALLAGCCSAALGQLPVERVAVTNDPSPLPGAPRFAVLHSHPGIFKYSGNIAFAADVAGIGTAVFWGPPGALQSVLATGDPAPGLGTGVSIQSVSPMVFVSPEPSLEDLIVQGTVFGPGYSSTNNYFGWVGPAGSLSVFYRSLDQVIGPTTTQLPAIPFQCAFALSWRVTAPITSSLASLTTNGPVYIAEQGQPIPGSSLTYQDVSFATASDSGSDPIAFIATTSAGGYKLLSGRPGILHVRVSSGDQAPGFAAGFFFGELDGGGPKRAPSLNFAGQAVFRASVVSATESSSGIFLSTPSGTYNTLCLAKQGQSAPGVVDGTFDFTDAPVLIIGENGTVVFSCKVQTPSGSLQALYAYRNSFTTIAVEGQPVPGQPGFFYTSFGRAWINYIGQVLFVATAANASQQHISVVLGGTPASIAKVVAVGDILAIGHEQTAVVSAVELASDPSGLDDGASPPMDASGRVVYWASLNNGALTGVFRASLFDACRANCDHSLTAPILNANDFQCFLNSFATGNSYANCDGSSLPPILNANDFQCFLNQYAAGCS